MRKGLLSLLLWIGFASPAFAEVCDKVVPSWSPSDGPVGQLENLWHFFSNPFSWIPLALLGVAIMAPRIWLFGLTIVFCALLLFASMVDFWLDDPLSYIHRSALREGCIAEPYAILAFFLAMMLYSIFRIAQMIRKRWKGKKDKGFSGLSAMIFASLFLSSSAFAEALPSFATEAEGKGIVYAEYASPQDSYPHRIMGRIREKDQLIVSTDQGKTYDLKLSQSNPGHVFEDIRPHIGDLDGDGFNDVMVVETSFTKGASIAIYAIKKEGLTKIAQTPFVRRPNRWYAPIGIGDFNGDGQGDIAFVDRPHLARILRIFSYIDGSLQEIKTVEGVSNHKIGEEFISSRIERKRKRDEIIIREASTGKETKINF